MTEIIGGNSCGKCKHYHPGDVENVCRRFPPVPYPSIIVVDDGGEGGMPVPQMIGKFSLFPTVRADWTCGEYERSLGVVLE